MTAASRAQAEVMAMLPDHDVVPWREQTCYVKDYLNAIKKAGLTVWLGDDPSPFYIQNFAPLAHRVRQQIMDQDMWRRADHTHTPTSQLRNNNPEWRAPLRPERATTNNGGSRQGSSESQKRCLSLVLFFGSDIDASRRDLGEVVNPTIA